MVYLREFIWVETKARFKLDCYIMMKYCMLKRFMKMYCKRDNLFVFCCVVLAFPHQYQPNIKCILYDTTDIHGN